MSINDEKSIIETLKIAPIYTFIITVFVAPILEELVFRLSFRKIFNKGYKLNDDSIFVGQIKQLLKNFNLPD